MESQSPISFMNESMNQASSKSSMSLSFLLLLIIGGMSRSLTFVYSPVSMS